MANNNFKYQVLNIRIDNLSHKEVIQKIEFFLASSHFHQIATINPEFILEAQKNSSFKKILNQTSLNVADGIGIKWALYYLGKKLKQRIAGADLMMEILKIASRKKLSIFLVVNKEGLSTFKEIRLAILKLYPHLNISGIELEKKFVPSSKIVIPPTANILFCNFGAPHQEFFINSQKNANVRLAMGVGGSFDFLTGKIHRAPKLMRNLGLEWLWRLILQPQRLKRIWKATILFPMKVIINK